MKQNLKPDLICFRLKVNAFLAHAFAAQVRLKIKIKVIVHEKNMRNEKMLTV